MNIDYMKNCTCRMSIVYYIYILYYYILSRYQINQIGMFEIKRGIVLFLYYSRIQQFISTEKFFQFIDSGHQILAYMIIIELQTFSFIHPDFSCSLDSALFPDQVFDFIGISDRDRIFRVLLIENQFLEYINSVFWVSIEIIILGLWILDAVFSRVDNEMIG